MRKLKQPTRVELARHIDDLADALSLIVHIDFKDSPTDIATEALKAHLAWLNRVF